MRRRALEAQDELYLAVVRRLHSRADLIIPDAEQALERELAGAVEDALEPLHTLLECTIRPRYGVLLQELLEGWSRGLRVCVEKRGHAPALHGVRQLIGGHAGRQGRGRTSRIRSHGRVAGTTLDAVGA